MELQVTHNQFPRPRAPATALVWSDAHLEELASDCRLPRCLLDLSVQKHVLYHFFDYYFNGILPQGTSPHQVVLPAVGITLHPYEEQNPRYLFDEKQFDDLSFLRLPEYPVGHPEMAFVAGVNPVAYQVQPGISLGRNKAIHALYLKAHATDPRVFQTSVKRLYDEFNTENQTANNTLLINLASFLGLLLMRGLTQDAIQLAKGVNKKVIKEHIHNLVGWPVANSYCAPCQSCVEGCATDLDKGKQVSTTLFTMVLHKWSVQGQAARGIRGVVPRIQAALLTHTAGNGLGLVMLMSKATEVLGVTFRETLAHTLTEQSKTSWELLAKFISYYFSVSNPQRSYFWARVINDSYFGDFAAKSHPHLAGIFAGIIDTQQTVGSITEFAWFTAKHVEAKAGYKWGRAVMERILGAEVVLSDLLKKNTKNVSV